MQLVAILLITVSVLTLLSGLAAFLGASKGDRGRSAWFFAATIFATIWMVTIALFFDAEPSWKEHMGIVINLTYLSAIFIDIALLGYVSWRYKIGKIITPIFIVLGVIFAAVFINNTNLLYTDIVLEKTGNSLVTNVGPFYFTYIAFFCLLVPTVIITLLNRIIKSTSARIKKSDLVLLIGFAISGTVSLVFNLILPFWTWSLIWLGPLAISTTIIAFYYSILRYRTLSLNSIWLKILSYIVVVASIAVLYMIVFYIIFSVIFRGSPPSTEVLILNFIMVLFFLILMPAISELLNVIRSLISGHETDKKEGKHVSRKTKE